MVNQYKSATMAGKIGSFSITFYLWFFLSSTVFAATGIFNPQISPDEVLTSSATTVTVTAELGTDAQHPLVQSSVILYETDVTGKPIRSLGIMHDDGKNGDPVASDTVFALQFTVNENIHINKYYKITAAYSGVRNRYQSQLLECVVYPSLPQALVPAVTESVQEIRSNYNIEVASIGILAAQQKALSDAIANPYIGPGNASLSGNILSLLYTYHDPESNYTFNIPGIVFLGDPNEPVDGAGRSVPSNLPADYKGPGNDKLLIFAPGYNNADPQQGIADHARSQFDNTEYIEFNPSPSIITMDDNASLEQISHWGDYGTVVMHTHGGLYSINSVAQVILVSGTPASLWNRMSYMIDIMAGRIGIADDGRFYIFPSYITAHASSMKNTVFYLGACESLQNDTMWNALQAKGAKVAFGWSETVNRGFNTTTFGRLIDPMLPHSDGQDPLTAKQAFDNVTPKTDSIGGHNATLTMRTASSEWEKFVFAEGGLINGNFETGNWTGWTHGADPGNLYGIISGANKHAGANSAVLGRWDTAFTGQDETLEPYGNEWIYQDFIVPSNATKLSFWWFMETYDTATWDWFDAKIQDPSTGATLQNIVYHGGKPGTNYGPYWNSGSWQYQEVNVTAYRGKKIRINFSQRLDGYGDQTRTFIDDVVVH